MSVTTIAPQCCALCLCAPPRNESGSREQGSAAKSRCSTRAVPTTAAQLSHPTVQARSALQQRTRLCSSATCNVRLRCLLVCLTVKHTSENAHVCAGRCDLCAGRESSHAAQNASVSTAQVAAHGRNRAQSLTQQLLLQSKQNQEHRGAGDAPLRAGALVARKRSRRHRRAHCENGHIREQVLERPL